jgi:hypothetical protein
MHTLYGGVGRVCVLSWWVRLKRPSCRPRCCKLEGGAGLYNCTDEWVAVEKVQSKGSIDRAVQRQLRGQRRECGMWESAVSLESQRRRGWHRVCRNGGGEC